MKKLRLLLALMVATGTFKAYAQDVVYRFDASPCPNTCVADLCNGVGTSAWFSLNTTDIATASTFNLGPGLSGAGSNPCGNMNGFAQGNPSSGRARWADNWPLSLTVNPNLDYFTFTLTANPFHLVQIDQISWQDQRSTTGPTLRQLRTSADNYTAIFPAAGSTTSTGWIGRSITTGLPNFSGTIQIRIYGYGNLPPASGGTGTNAGSLRIDNVQVFAHILITNLPIELLSFTGEKIDESKVKLLWSTASERDNDYFTVFRCNDLITWQEIGRVAGAGFSQSLTNYELVDASPLTGTNYYKLRQTDFDETFADSQVIAVDVDVGDTFVTYQNPTARGQPIRASKKVDFIVDQTGRLVPFEPTSIIIETPGAYTLVHIDENGFSTTCRLIITN